MIPPFTIDGYKTLVHRIMNGGFQIKPISALPDRKENCIYLRHDVDFSAELAIRVAEIENTAGVVSTYFFLLTGPYNPFHEETVAAIKKIKSLGHEIGLHYDLKNWPHDKQAANAKLKNEIQILEGISETKINSIVMHQPSLGGEDYFAKGTDSTLLVNPTYYQKTDGDLCYVSDSCRAWRDDTLMKFIRRELPQTRLMLNTHPESWLATKRMNRITYLEKVLAPAANQCANDYFFKTVKALWETQPAAVNGIGDEDEN